MELDNRIADLLEDRIIDRLGGGGSEDVYNLLLEDANDFLLEDNSFILVE
jgi:hypothetical protein